MVRQVSVEPSVPIVRELSKPSFSFIQAGSRWEMLLGVKDMPDLQDNQGKPRTDNVIIVQGCRKEEKCEDVMAAFVI
jgi:hypothetical protein